jgi:hypothetical protein
VLGYDIITLEVVLWVKDVVLGILIGAKFTMAVVYF